MWVGSRRSRVLGGVPPKWLLVGLEPLLSLRAPEAFTIAPKEWPLHLNFTKVLKSRILAPIENLENSASNPTLENFFVTIFISTSVGLASKIQTAQKNNHLLY